MGSVSIIDGSNTCVCCGRDIPEGSQVCVICGDIPKKKVKTNYDRIRNMSVEEMSNFLMNWFIDDITGNAPMNVLKWLESVSESD